MPSFYPSAMNTFPPTPPHIRLETDQSYYPTGRTAFPVTYAGGCEFVENQPPSTCYSSRQSMSTHPQPPHLVHPGREMGVSKAIFSNHLPHTMYGSVSAGSGLPPLRPTAKLPPMDSAIPSQYRRHETKVQQEQRPKEQKSTGGVAAHLDYEMDQMTDFVAEMAHGIVYPGNTVPPQFKKYVSQILSSTRLPCSTILLGLYYLASRMRKLSAAEVYAFGSGQVYRMLTTALLLGSKFLDDNTFQNRSWSEVSNIPVAELNAMELEWLFGFEWKIHNRLHNQHDGFMTWKAHWETWRAKAEARVHESRTKLAPIDTNIQRHPSIPKAMISPDGPIPPQYQRSTWLTPMSADYSPPSAPHTGPTTPDHYQVAPWPYNNNTSYSRAWLPSQVYPPSVPRSQPPSYQHTPSYTLPFSPSVWTGHGSACGCLYCAKGNEHYLSTASFGIQPVVG